MNSDKMTGMRLQDNNKKNEKETKKRNRYKTSLIFYSIFSPLTSSGFFLSFLPKILKEKQHQAAWFETDLFCLTNVVGNYFRNKVQSILTFSLVT